MALIDWVRCIHSDGWHNAFTDLQLFQGKYYVCFRNGLSHVSTEGKVVVIASDDLCQWQRVSVPINTTGDNRDPHMVATPDRLFVISGTCSFDYPLAVHGEAEFNIRSYCSYTDDGVTWSTPQQIYHEGYCLWGVGYINGTFYNLAYGNKKGNKKDFDNESKGLFLLSSSDGLDWKKVSQVSPNGTEATFRIATDGTIRVAIRHSDDTRLNFATAKPPFEHWQLTDLGEAIASPKLIEVGGQEYIIGRQHLRDANDRHTIVDRRTSVWRLENDRIEHVLDLPSSGDTSYVGVIVQEDESVLLSYYSQHEVKYGTKRWIYPANIYLAQIRL